MEALEQEAEQLGQYGLLLRGQVGDQLGFSAKSLPQPGQCDQLSDPSRIRLPG